MTTDAAITSARAALAAEIAAKLELTAERYDPGTPVWRKDWILVHGYAAADEAIAEAQARVDWLESAAVIMAAP